MTSANPRVLHFVEDGDTSGFFPQLGRFHDRRRFEMLLGTLKPITEDLRRAMLDQGITTVSLGARRRSAYPIALPRLVAWLRQQRIDVLHTHLFDPSVVGLTGGMLAGVRVRVMTRHYSDYHTRIGKRWHVRLDQMCTRFAHRVIAISEQTRRVMLDEEQAPDAKIRVIHNGIDLSRVAWPSEEALAALRAELSLAGRHVLSVVARLHPEKGQEHLFRAMPRIVAATEGRVCLLVAGAGGFRQQYEACVRDLGMQAFVRFLGFRNDVASILAASDVVVLPSVAEAFGLAVTEAMALQRAVVATRVGGIPEIVVDGVTGILVPPASPDDLADAVCGLLKDPDRRRALGLAGRRIVEAKFRFEVMMRRYEAVYDTLLAPGRTGTES